MTEKDILKALHRETQLIGGVCDERVKRIPKAGLPDELQRDATHPREDVDLNRAISFGHSTLDTLLELGVVWKRCQTLRSVKSEPEVERTLCEMS